MGGEVLGLSYVGEELGRDLQKTYILLISERGMTTPSIE